MIDRNDKNSPIDACMIKENLKTFEGYHFYGMQENGDPWRAQLSKEVMESYCMSDELILSTRLSDDVYRGAIKFAKALVVDTTPIDEIQKAAVG